MQCSWQQAAGQSRPTKRGRQQAGYTRVMDVRVRREFKDLLSDPLTPYNQLVEALGYKGELPQSPADQLTASKETTQKRKHAVYTNTVKRKWRLKSMSSLRHQWLSSFLGEHQYFQPGPQRGYPNIQQLCLSRASLEAWAEENKPQVSSGSLQAWSTCP